MSALGCEEVRDLLPGRVREALPATLAREVDAHLARCETCALERRAVAMLREDQPPVPPGLALEIRRALREEALRGTEGVPAGAGRSTPIRLPWAVARARFAPRAWTAAAVLVLAVAGALLVRRGPPAVEPEGLGGALEGAPSLWLAGDGTVAGAPLMDDLSDLSDDELRSLLAELEG